jgi:signal transduction histidine kinase
MAVPSPRSPSPAWFAGFLRVPLFLKVSLAHGVPVLALGVLALVLGPGLDPEAPAPLLSLGLWGGAVLAVIGIGAALSYLALVPLRRIEEVAGRVQRGDLSARVPPSPLADDDLHRLGRALNRVLDSAEEHRALRRELAARSIQAQEEERKRMAHELVDGTAQTLSATLLHLQLAGRKLPLPPRRSDAAPGSPPPPDPAADLEAARRELLSALAGIQRIARGLHPPELDELGALKALEAHARRLSEEVGVPIRVHPPHSSPDLSADQRLTLYRVMQEAMNNAVVHGKPTRVDLFVEVGPGRVTARLEDDGSGFEPDRVTSDPQDHIGILRMLERARHSGGKLHIESAPGEGTLVLLVLSEDVGRSHTRSPAIESAPVGKSPTTGPGNPLTDPSMQES